MPVRIPDIADFDFGQSKSFILPESEPSPQQWLVYTAWHISRALKCYEADLMKGQNNYTVATVLGEFKELKVVRAIQPFTRVRRGKVEQVNIKEPLRPREQAAILLYALFPGLESEQCTCCRKTTSSGPFANCISRADRWTDGACLNCYFTGAGSKCSLRRRHSVAQPLELEETRQIPRGFPEGIERGALTEDLHTWLAQIEAEQKRRLAKREHSMSST